MPTVAEMDGDIESREERAKEQGLSPALSVGNLLQSRGICGILAPDPVLANRKTRFSVHCTVIQDGEHLLNCIRYVDLNMVRAGEVRHPANWPACGYDELTGKRKRYRIIDTKHLVARTGMQSVADLHAWYREGSERKLAERRMEREAHWAESLAVGERRFIDRMRREYDRRAQFVTDQAPDGAWHVRETRTPYRTENGR